MKHWNETWYITRVSLADDGEEKEWSCVSQRQRLWVEDEVDPLAASRPSTRNAEYTRILVIEGAVPIAAMRRVLSKEDIQLPTVFLDKQETVSTRCTAVPDQNSFLSYWLDQFTTSVTENIVLHFVRDQSGRLSFHPKYECSDQRLKLVRQSKHRSNRIAK